MPVPCLAGMHCEQEGNVRIVRIEEEESAQIVPVVARHDGEVGVELVIGLREESAVGATAGFGVTLSVAIIPPVSCAFTFHAVVWKLWRGDQNCQRNWHITMICQPEEFRDRLAVCR